jgi:ArsR family transcriptional regulator, cadmium/lead-responsive transcriptional repressor
MTTNESVLPMHFGPTAPPVNERATAAFFAVLSSPIRLSVLQLLVDGERCVTELVDTLQIAQPRLSNHLACLRRCGFVQVRRQGTFLHYSLADPRLADIVRLGVSLAQPSAGTLLRCPVLGTERQA